MKLWKVLGLAGLAGVAATGVAVARAERQRRAYTADEVRERLQQRVVEASVGSGGAAEDEPRAGAGRRARMSAVAARWRRRMSWRSAIRRRTGSGSTEPGAPSGR